ncbi:MAG: LemA family protein, partial [Endomicrobia bacterium]|nr:LemA family protein [Endomicrobiia bacterium]
PQLVEVCKGYMAHERETLQKVVEARNIFMNVGANAEKFSANSALDKALGSLFAVSEGYPALKANEEFMHLHRRITAIENQIADRREFYNASVAIFNTRINQIPDMVIANILKYKAKPMFKVETKSELDAHPISF